MSVIGRDEFWDAPTKAELQADRDRWRREFDMERAKVQRLEHDLQQHRGAVSAIREALELLDPDSGARKEADITAACEQLERLVSRLQGGQ